MQIKKPIKKEGKEVTTTKTDEGEKSSWQKLVQGIVRPPRSTYKETSLGTVAGS